MLFSEKRSCLRHSPTHSLGHSHVLCFNFGPIFKESECPNPTLTWTNPIHSWNHRVLAPSPDCWWGTRWWKNRKVWWDFLVRCISVSWYTANRYIHILYTRNSRVLSCSLKPFTKLPSCVHPISQTYKSHWLASSIFFWSRTSMPVSLGAMSVFTFSTAYSHGGWSILHQALVAAVQCLCHLCESRLKCWVF